MAASSASDFIRNVVTSDDILKATRSPGTLVKNDDWRLDMQMVPYPEPLSHMIFP